jgi:hypothetical protein
VQIAPFDFGHCTRLIIATPWDHAIDMATNRLQSLLERSGGRPPFRSAKGNPAEDEDIWWAFDGAVKDLAYQGVDVAIMKCREHEGFYLPLGEWNPKGEGEKFIFGMAQAVRHARDAAVREAEAELNMSVAAVVEGKRKKAREFGRGMGFFV